MTAQPTQPYFGSGLDEAVEAEDALSATRGGGFRRKHFFPDPGKGKFVFVRYVSDQIIYAMAHIGVPTKPKPSDWPENAKWPEAMGAVCRYDKAFKANPERGLLADIYSDCWVCDAKPTNKWGRPCNATLRVWAIAALREEVLGTPELIAQHGLSADMIGKRIGFRDVMREYDEVDAEGKPTGNKKKEIALVIVNKAVSNYFGGLQTMKGLFGSITDRDYIIKQSGEKKDVDFQHIHLEPDGLKPGTEAWKRYENAMAEQKLNLGEIVGQQATNEYFARFFDPTKAAPPTKQRDGAVTPSAQSGPPISQQGAAPSNEPSEEAVRAMRDRVRGVAAQAASQGQPQDAPQDAPQGQPATVGASPSGLIDLG